MPAMTTKTFMWENSVSLNIFFLRLGGLWPRQRYKLDLYTTYTGLILISQFLFLVLDAVKLYEVRNDLEVLMEFSLYVSAQLMCFLKTCVVVFNWAKIRRLVAILKSELFQPTTKTQDNIMAQSLEFWQKLYKLFMGCVTIAGSLWVLLPILTGSYKKGVLPLQTFCPFSCDENPNYVLVYLFEVFNVGNAVIGAFNGDMFVFAFFVSIEVQCELLCDNLRQLECHPKLFRDNLLRAVKQHQELLSFTREFNAFYAFILLFQFFLSTLLLALIVLQANWLTPGTFMFYSRIGAGISFILQIFVYCWFGTNIQSKICYSIFESSWLRQPISVKKKLFMFILNCQTPIKISAFNFFYLSLEVFIKIVKSAWSFLMILQQVTNKN